MDKESVEVSIEQKAFEDYALQCEKSGNSKEKTTERLLSYFCKLNEKKPEQKEQAREQ